MKGFTLIEVLVALVVLAAALGAGVRAASGIVEREAGRDLRMAARWVASDRIAELRARRLFPRPGSDAGQVEQAGHLLYWRQTVEATPLLKFRHLRVDVAETPDGPALASLATVMYGDRL